MFDKTKFFKKIYSDRIAGGKWREGDSINYLPGSNYTVEYCTEEEYNEIRLAVKNKTIQDNLVEELIQEKIRQQAIEALEQEGVIESDRRY